MQNQAGVSGFVDTFSSDWNMLRHIVLPELTQVTFIVIVVTSVGALPK